MEDSDGGLHPAVDGQSLGESEKVKVTQWTCCLTEVAEHVASFDIVRRCRLFH